MQISFKKEVKIGILLVLTISFFFIGYNFLKGRNILKPTSYYYVVYDDIGGLMESGHVIKSGYRIGSVDNIRFADNQDHLVVRLAIPQSFDLPVGSVARIFSLDVMGTMAIEIIPGTSDAKHGPGDTLYAALKPGFIDVISDQLTPVASKAESMMSSIDSVMIVIHSMLDSDFRESFSASSAHLSNTLYAMDTLLTKENSRLNNILASLESITDNFAGSNEHISSTLNNIAAISDSLAGSELLSAVNNLNEVLSEVNSTMEGVNRGDGSFGKLLTDDELYNNLESAAKNLDLLLIDLQESPGRYVHFSIFGRKQK
jgi:phospholipid/cholesterol/gamma-HCH transport system substrate-binding protein